MAGLRINLDADLTRFTQLVKQIQKVRAELGKLSTASPSYDKLYKEFKRIKGELDEMKKKFAEIQTALAQVDIASSIVKQSETIRHEKMCIRDRMESDSVAMYVGEYSYVPSYRSSYSLKRCV